MSMDVLYSYISWHYADTTHSNGLLQPRVQVFTLTCPTMSRFVCCAQCSRCQLWPSLYYAEGRHSPVLAMAAFPMLIKITSATAPYICIVAIGAHPRQRLPHAPSFSQNNYESRSGRNHIYMSITCSKTGRSDRMDVLVNKLSAGAIVFQKQLLLVDEQAKRSSFIMNSMRRHKIVRKF